MGRVLLTVQMEPAPASLDEVCNRLDVSESQVDSDFGVVEIDPHQHLYAVRIDEEAVPHATRAQGVEGPYADPRIEPMGPPEA